jgi:hypothetical protein
MMEMITECIAFAEVFFQGFVEIDQAHFETRFDPSCNLYILAFCSPISHHKNIHYLTNGSMPAKAEPFSCRPG